MNLQNMSLEEISWRSYYPGHIDTVDEVFIPALRCSTNYDRITGDFSSSVLSVLAPGLRDFVNRGGKIRLMLGLRLFDEDLKAIKEGEKNQVIRKQIDWEGLQEGQPEEVLEALSWLIANDVLEIKVGAVTDHLGNIRSTDYGQWHQKIAIFSDDEGNTVAMAGSPNASFKALRRNRESLAPNSNWEGGPGEPRATREISREFESLWKDDADGTAVMNIPDALREDILETLPDKEPDWGALTSEGHDYAEEIEPYSYQKRALNKLSANNNRLLIKHATGTGKTWTALFALDRIAEAEDVVVLLAPTKDLVRQWASDGNLNKFFPDATILKCSSEFDWKKRLFNNLHMERSEPLFVVSTMHPQTMETVFERIREATEPNQRLIIADEVHNLGAPMTRSIVVEFDAGKARIGLSATPYRGDAGDDFIDEYFGGTVDEVTIEEAIEEYEVLSPYNYYIHMVSLNEDERVEYAERSSEISHLYHKYRSDEEESLLDVANRYWDLQEEIFDRADILKECEEKTRVTHELFDSIGSKTIIFCNTTDHARGVNSRIGKDSNRTVQPFLGEYSDEKRESFLQYFEEGFIDTLVSIDCLTEGIDVPACDSAVLIANSTSTRESVQRRGRVLRESGDGGIAEIHDFVTLPIEKELIESGVELESHESRLVIRELDRVERMNEAANNRAENNIDIIELRSCVRDQSNHDNN
jgi:superfamily II DNA or RNA helicase